MSYPEYMPASTVVAVEEYLSTSYDPDREYIDGVVVERNLGERDHSRPQGLICTYLMSRERAWRVVTLLAQRVQVGDSRFRIPDVCLLRASDLAEPIVGTAPIVCVEVLSRDDRMPAVREKVRDYVAMGVKHVWVIDPRGRRGFNFTANAMEEPADGVLRVLDSEIQLPLDEIFRDLVLRP